MLPIVQKVSQWFSQPVKEQPFPAKGQVWAMMDTVVDYHCTPIVATIDDVVDGFVSYSTNYKTVFTIPMDKFTASYQFQSNPCAIPV